MLKTSYETPRDRSKENEFCKKLADHWHTYTFIQTERFANHDFYIVDKHNQLRAVLEIKIRDCQYTTYQSLLISEKKIKNLLFWNDYTAYLDSYDQIIELNKDTKTSPVVGILAVRYLDGDYYYKLTRQDFNCDLREGKIIYKTESGRTKNTRDKNDIEPCYLIHRSLLKEIGESKIKGKVKFRALREN